MLHTECDSCKYNLRLENVLYIPENKNNLLSLGCWEKEGRQYIGNNGELMLINASGESVAKGMKVRNALYKMDVTVRKKERIHSLTGDRYVFEVHAEKHTWETWHRRFGHISYKGLRRLNNLGLVQGLNVDDESPIPDCITCTEAKLTQEPYKKIEHNTQTPGELTHIDVWGKYDRVSIEGHSYYVLFVDDATRFTTVHFLKWKDEASQKVIEYLAYLRVQGKPPKVIHVDRGKEFMNEILSSWCRAHGITMDATAPYSPLQNGVAERMNRTLVELARAMLKGQNMPEFLWESAVAHAAYVRNRAYTRVLERVTPYELWFGSKPSVAHLREFGVPVWVLLQGQKVPCKMLSKSQRRAFVGFEDGLKAMKYYNAESQKILILRNFRFLSPQANSPPEEIVLTPDVLREGESGKSAQPSSDEKQPEGKQSVDSKRKQSEVDENEDLTHLAERMGSASIIVSWKTPSQMRKKTRKMIW